MNLQGVCTSLRFALAIELYWPYIAYCMALCAAYASALWSHADPGAARSSFVASCTELLEQALWRMLFKAIGVWLLGGSMLLGASNWLCQRMVH
jgi:hypothetical protein